MNRNSSALSMSFFGRLMAGLLGSAFFAVVFALCFAEGAQAAPARPDAFWLTQPDGDKFRAKLIGDEWFNTTETATGYAVVKNAKGVWTYATTRVDGNLVPTAAVAGKDQVPSSIPKHLRDAVKRANGRQLKQSSSARMAKSASLGRNAAGQTPSLGPDHSLVILAEFTNQAHIATTAAQWSSNFFSSAHKSVADYYAKASYGQFSLSPVTESSGTANDGVVGWVTLPMNHPNQTTIDNDNRTVAQKAIQAADPFVNFSTYDTNDDGVITTDELHVTVIVAGYEASYGVGTPVVWGHEWSLYGSVPAPTVDGVSVGGDGYTEFGEMHGDHMAAIGIMIHEMGHDLGLPDLYDTDYGSDGVGLWSVMAYGSWAMTPTDTIPGATPPLPDAWCKWTKGWITPVEVTGTAAKSVSAASSASKTNVAVQLRNNPGGADWTWFGGSSGEFFLVENRQQTPGSYDESLPGSGLLVLHVDESQADNSIDSTRLVKVIEADNSNALGTQGGDQGSAGDLFPGSTNNRTFNDTSTPNSKLNSGAASGVAISAIGNSGATMSATFTAPGGVPAKPSAPLTVTAAAGNASVTGSWAAPATNPGLVTGYVATAYNHPSNTTTGLSCPSSTAARTCTITGLTNGNTYRIRVYATSAAGNSPLSSYSAVFTPAVPVSLVNTVLPSYTGTPKVGTASVAKKGTWTGAHGLAGVTYAYRWLRDGVAISGTAAAVESYSPKAADVGKSLSVKVTASGPGYLPTSATSAGKIVKKATIVLTETAANATKRTNGVFLGNTISLTFTTGTWANGATVKAYLNGNKLAGTATVASGKFTIVVSTNMPGVVVGLQDLKLSVAATATSNAKSQLFDLNIK